MENYKKNNKIDRVYEGTSDLFRYNEEASLATTDQGNDDEDFESDSEEDEIYDDDEDEDWQP